MLHIRKQATSNPRPTSQVFKPMAPFSVAFLAASPVMPVWLGACAGAFMWFVCMSQQFHAWAHMRRSELHPAVLALMDAGLLISCKAHGAHHRQPYEGDYCIVSGMWNGVLDQSGFFRGLEKIVQKVSCLDRSDGEPFHQAMLGTTRLAFRSRVNMWLMAVHGDIHIHSVDLLSQAQRVAFGC